MSDDTLQASLISKQQELEKRIAAIKADFKKGRSQDFAEQTTESENDETLDEIHSEALLELSQVNLALQRLGSGHYGTCSGCSEPINPERLKALPYTSTCIKCATKESL